MKKTVIINRAISGSGKTTMTNCIVRKLQFENISVSVHSTDNFFIIDGKYIFDFDKLGTYHQENFKKFKQSIENNIDVVICDNTNIAPWETEVYTKLAREYNYQILIITFDPRELEEHILSQRITKENPNAHGVNEEVLKNMIRRYYVFDDLLNPNIVVNLNKHINYTWDKERKEREERVERVDIQISKHFDSDFVIRVTPDDFKEYHVVMEEQILKILENGE